MVNDGDLSISKACELVGLSRRAWYSDDPADKQLPRDRPVIDALNKLVEQHPRWGFWKYFHALRMAGRRCNHKRVWRIYCAMNLNQKRRAKRRLPDRLRTPLEAPSMPNHTWSFDFMSDTLYSRHRYRVLNVLDAGTREAQDITVGTSLPAGRVVRVLDTLIAEHGKPFRIRVDNGAEMTPTVFVQWCERQQIQIVYIQPGKPNQNAYIEQFNRSFRHEVLDVNLFRTLGDVREVAWAWQITYNEERPHAAPGNVPPAQFKRLITAGDPINPLCA